ncbi:unnamed protein product [Meloidogyne enterolobii]|uniref:Uncharacterized protein n=2 Tax=Meloidogyne enterolobii TaxID=390850 RepID=A0ACB1AG15_MELEN
MSKLRFYLGTKFDKLLREEKLIEKYEYFSIPLNIKKFDDALKERLNVLSEYVQEKEKNKKENEKSFLKYDAKILDINTVNEKPLAILDKVYKGKNFEIPFDLIFCDFEKQMKYGVVILHKKDFNNRIFKEDQNMIIKTNSIDSSLLKKLETLKKESFFLSKQIRQRYYNLEYLIKNGMKKVENNFQNFLTRTGKVYATRPDARLVSPSGIVENISVQIFETETTIQIQSEIPMAIVELIEEVKNEREELKEMNDEEFKMKWKESIIEEAKYKNDKELNENLKPIKNKQQKILDEELKELNGKHMGTEMRIKFIKQNFEKSEKLKKKQLKEVKNLQEKSDKIMSKIWEIKDEMNHGFKEELDKISYKNEKILEEKLGEIKVENDKILVGDMEDERKQMLEKYDDFIVELKEEWFRAVFNHVFKGYKSGDKKKVIIKLGKEIEEEKKGEASTSYDIETIGKNEHILYFDTNSLIGKTFLLKIYGKENAVKLVKGRKDSAIFVNINDEARKENDEKINKGMLIKIKV